MAEWACCGPSYLPRTVVVLPQVEFISCWQIFHRQVQLSEQNVELNEPSVSFNIFFHVTKIILEALVRDVVGFYFLMFSM